MKKSRTIDIFVRDKQTTKPKCVLYRYVGTTSTSATCYEAKEKYLWTTEGRKLKPSDVQCRFAKDV